MVIRPHRPVERVPLPRANKYVTKALTPFITGRLSGSVARGVFKSIPYIRAASTAYEVYKVGTQLYKSYKSAKAASIKTGMPIAGKKRKSEHNPGSYKRHHTMITPTMKRYWAKRARRNARLRPKKGIRYSKRKRVTHVSAGDPKAHTYVSIAYKRMFIGKMYQMISGKNQYSAIFTRQLHTANNQNVNRQYSQLTATAFNGTDVGAIVNAYFNNLKNNDPYFQKLPGNEDQGFNVHLQSMTLKADLLNQTEAPTFVDIYTVMAKTTGTYESPITTWTNAILSDKGSGSVGTQNFPHDKPTYHKQFNLTWKVVKVQKILLNPGITHHHRFTFKVNRLTDWDYWRKYSMIKGITHATFIVAHGTPCDDTQGMSQAGPQIVTWTPVKIDTVGQVHYNWRMLAKMVANHYYESGLGNLNYTGTGTPTLYQQNAVSGTGPTNLNVEALIG